MRFDVPATRASQAMAWSNQVIIRLRAIRFPLRRSEMSGSRSIKGWTMPVISSRRASSPSASAWARAWAALSGFDVR